MLQFVTVLVKISAKVASWQPTDLKKKKKLMFPFFLFRCSASIRHALA